jgi:hypothetical protein
VKHSQYTRSSRARIHPSIQLASPMRVVLQHPHPILLSADSDGSTIKATISHAH